MANGAFTLQGFESPEEVQARIGKAEQAALRPTGDINQMIFETAARGGAGLGTAVAGALGFEDPAVKKARQVQETMQGLDPADPQSYFEGSKRLNEAGLTKEALFIADKGNSLLKDQRAAETKAKGRGDYWTLKSFVDEKGVTVQVPYNHRTNEFDWSNQKSTNKEGLLIDPKTPKNQARIKDAKKRAEIQAKEETEAQIALPKIRSDSEYVAGIVDQVLEHPAFESVVGMPSIGKGLQFISGTPEADFRALQKQIGGKVFMEAYKTLKGGGQITEIEGEKATESLTRMRTSVSEESFIEAATDFKNELKRFERLAEIRAGMSPIKIKLDQKASERATQVALDGNGERVFEINGVWKYADGKKYGSK